MNALRRIRSAVMFAAVFLLPILGLSETEEVGDYTWSFTIADTESEFLAMRAASPVWELLTGAGLPKVAWPEDYDMAAVGPSLGYVHRNEGHGLSVYDWKWLLDFADKVFSLKDKERNCHER